MALPAELRAVVAKVNKDYGVGAVVIASDIQVHTRYTTGHLGLDVALGGGMPANQPIEIVGMESHGKTALVLKMIAANQAINPDFLTLWVAAEHYDVDQAAALGVDNDRVVVHSTQAMEEAFEVMLSFGESRAVDCIVLDSYPALTPDEEAEKGMDEFTMAIGARMFGKFFRKWGSKVRHDITNPDDKPMLGPIIINQFRDKIGGYSPQGGTPRTTPGGNAKNYAFYVRLEVARDEFFKESIGGVVVPVGQTIKVTTTKNKSAPPRQVAVLDFYFRDAPKRGFKRGEYDLGSDIILMALLFGVITRGGAWFSFNNGELDDMGKPKHRWMGKEALATGILESPDLFAEVKAEVMRRAKDPAAAHEISATDVESAQTLGEKKVKRKSTAA